MQTLRLLLWVLPSRRTLRLTAYLVSVCLFAAVLAGRSAYAKAKEAALAFGAQLSGLEDLTAGANVILVNGERFHRATVFSKEAIGTVLDRIQADCLATPGLLGQVGEALRSHPKAAKEFSFRPNILRGIVRSDEEGRGMVACFTDARVLGLGGLIDAASRFAKSSNLAEFGHFRYAFADRMETGETMVTTLWADTNLNLSTMFPVHGDAAGADSRVLPRPKASRRMLAAAAEAQPFAVRLYDTSEPPTSVLRFYEGWMQKNGWVFGGKVEGKGFSYLRDDGYQAIVSATERDGRTTVGLIEAGRAEGSIVSTTVKAAE